MNREYVRHIRDFLKTKGVSWKEMIGDSVEKDFRLAEDSDFYYQGFQTLEIETEDSKLTINTQIDYVHFKLLGLDSDSLDKFLNSNEIFSEYKKDMSLDWIDYQKKNCKRIFKSLINKHCDQQKQEAYNSYLDRTKNRRNLLNRLASRLDAEQRRLNEITDNPALEDKFKLKIKRIKKKYDYTERCLKKSQRSYDEDLRIIEEIRKIAN